MWCISCGAHTPSHVRFCPSCGAQQPPAVQPQPAAAQPVAVQPGPVAAAQPQQTVAPASEVPTSGPARTLDLTLAYPTLAFLYAMTRPKVRIGDVVEHRLPWGSHRIPVPPGPVRIDVVTPYLGIKAGRAHAQVDGFSPNPSLQYKAPWLVPMRGDLAERARYRGGVLVAAILALLVAAPIVLVAVAGTAPWSTVADEVGSASTEDSVDVQDPDVSTDPDAQTGDGDVEPAPDVVEPTWTAATLAPVLDAVADDEAEDWAYFAGDSIVIIPCGGEGAHGVSPELVERTAGGANIGASAQIFTDPSAAGTEMDRLSGLLENCGPHDYVMRSGSVLSACDTPVIASWTPVIRYEQSCAEVANGAPSHHVIVRSGNAVVALSAGSTHAGQMESLLPGLLVELQGGAQAGTGGLDTADFTTDWSGQATGRYAGQLAMQVGTYGSGGGPSEPLTGDFSLRDLDCYGYWDEVSRDGTSVTALVEIDSDSQDLCDDEITMTLRLEADGRLFVDGGDWSAVLEAELE